jgi:hypothetical protein
MPASHPDHDAELAQLRVATQRLWNALQQPHVAAPSTAHTSSSLELDPSPVPTPPPACSLELAQDEEPEASLPAHAPVGCFGPQHHLTPEQAWEAQQRLTKANRERPIQGKHAQQRYARRIAGIISAVRHGRINNSRWGRRMLATKGGNTMRDHALHHLRTIAPLGAEAAQAARERQKAFGGLGAAAEPPADL